MVERGRLKTAAAIGLRAGRVGTPRRWPSTSASRSLTGVRVRAGRGLDRRGGRPRRAVRRADQVPAERLASAGGRRDVQALAAVERVQGHEGRRPGGPADLPLARGPGPGAPVVCLLAAYVRWHLEAAWAPLLFRDEAPPERADPVAPRPRSAGAFARTAATGRPTACRSAASRRSSVELVSPHPQPGPAGGAPERRRSTCWPSRPRSRLGHSS